MALPKVMCVITAFSQEGKAATIKGKKDKVGVGFVLLTLWVVEILGRRQDGPH